MKITQSQLRRIIREQLDWSNRPGGYDDPAYAADAAKVPIDDIAKGKMFDEIVANLERNPLMGGRELVDDVRLAIGPSVDSNDVYDFLDELLEDGILHFNVEEDEWSLTSV